MKHLCETCTNCQIDGKCTVSGKYYEKILKCVSYVHKHNCLNCGHLVRPLAGGLLCESSGRTDISGDTFCTDWIEVRSCKTCEYKNGNAKCSYSEVDPDGICTFYIKWKKKDDHQEENDNQEKSDKPSEDRWTDNPKVHPEHYNNSKISPYDIWDDWKLDPYTATAVKYIKRAGSKDGESAIDDLEKSIDYLKERVKRLKKDEHEKQ